MNEAVGIDCESLSVRHGAVWALRDVTLRIGTGVTAVLGPNGAGKSTLLRLLATQCAPSRGSFSVGGLDPRRQSDLNRLRLDMGFLPQQFECMEWSSALRNVEYSAWAHGVAVPDCNAAAYDALSLVGLSHVAGMQVRKLSGGMRQRLGLACAVAHRPHVLILDEPTVGIDPRQRMDIRRFLKDYAAQGDVIVIMSTHIVDEIQTLASDVLVLDRGSVAFHGSLERFRSFGGERDGLGSVWELAYAAVLDRSEHTGARGSDPVGSA